MAKRFELNMFGLDVIMRHDYETDGVSQKINEYRARSIKELTEFLTNVPGSDEFENFMDIGCGDDHDIKLFIQNNPEYKKFTGIDLFSPKTKSSFYNIKNNKNYIYNIYKQDWYTIKDTFNEEKQSLFFGNQDVIYVNHSLEHAANIYSLMENIVTCHNKGGVLFISVPDGNSPFGYSITSSTTHFSVITEGFLSTTLQRFGYNVAVERREFREGAPEIWAFAVRQ